MPIRIDEISQNHARKHFDCGVEELNRFLQQQARQKTVRQISKTYIACDSNDRERVLGYYTLCGYSVTTPPDHRDYKRYPHPLNAVKLARLAIDLTQQKQRLGEHLLVDAIYRTTLVSEQISTIGLFVDPMTPSVKPFYQQYGFLDADPGNPARLEMWLPIKTCIDLIAQIS